MPAPPFEAPRDLFAWSAELLEEAQRRLDAAHATACRIIQPRTRADENRRAIDRVCELTP